MLIVVDIGNSNVVIGLKEQDKWIHIWRLETIHSENTSNQYLKGITDLIFKNKVDLNLIEGVIMSSVVPVLTPILTDIFQDTYHMKVISIGPNIYPLLEIDIMRPDQIGTDLVANAYSAFKKYGGKVSVIDFGTALTITTINEKGKILGVSIAPGIKTAIKALVQNTAQLPDISLQLPNSVLGTDTISAMQAGILWGYVGMVREMTKKIKEELDADYKIVGTGGLSFIMAEVNEIFDHYDTTLTIDGLAYMWQEVEKQ